MKKTLLSLILTLVSLTTFAYSFQVDGIYYNILSSSDKTCELTKGTYYYNGNFVIPSTVSYDSTEYTVISIENNTFEHNSFLTSVTIPNSVTSIGNYAFYDCYGLTSVTIGNSVTTIGYGAFDGCSGLASVSIPNSVTSIGGRTFDGCSGLTSVLIPNSVTSIGDLAFSDCSGLINIQVEAGNKNYDSRNNCNAIINSYTNELIVGCKNTTIPNSVTSIGEFAFYGCSSLTSMTIPNSVTAIGDCAFSGFSGLTSVTIPNSVKTIGVQSFRDCSRLTSVSIPNSVTSIGYSAFLNCEGLVAVTIPNSVTSIGYSAFEGCSSLVSVTIPNNLTSIESGVFHNCSRLTSVTIGNSVTSITEKTVRTRGAFQGCTNLFEVYNLSSLDLTIGSTNNGYVAYYAKKIHTSLDEPSIIQEIDGFQFTNIETPQLLGYTGNERNIVLPNDFNGKNYIIADKAFSYCSNITSLSIPNSINSIGNYAFQGCSGLTSVIIPNSVNSIGNYAFSGCSGLTTVVIPNMITSLESSTFKGCSSIKDLINMCSSPQTNTGLLPTTATLHVLKGCKSAYATSSAWSKYNIIEDAETFFPIESVSLEKEKMYVKTGSVFKLTPAIEPSVVPTNIYDLIWMSSAPDVLYLDQSTQRFMAMKEGTATVTVMAIDANENMKTAQVIVYVGDGIDPEENGNPQCEAPIVKYTNGNIICVSATDNAVCHYTYKIFGEGEGTETGSSADTPMKIEITAYATADGYSQSKNTVKTFDYNAGAGNYDLDGDGRVTMKDANIIVNKYLGK